MIVAQVADFSQILADYFILAACCTPHTLQSHPPDISWQPCADKCQRKHVNVHTDIEMASFIDYSLDSVF